jgi:hypothetical protein
MKVIQALCISILLIASPFAVANVVDYTFSTIHGTYVQIVGGTIHDMSGGSGYGYYEFLNIPIGFTFTFNDSSYSTISFNTDGFASFQTSLASSDEVISTGMSREVIAPLNGELWGRPSSQLMTQLAGSSPNRTFTIQWSNFDFFGRSGDTCNFQIILYETTNIIDMVYDITWSTGTSYEDVQVGLKGNLWDDRVTRTTQTDWNQTVEGDKHGTCLLSNSVRPASGLVFRWTPPQQTDVNDEEVFGPNRILLRQNYPNPFNPSTNMSFVIRNSSLVTLKVYDILGREVATLVDGVEQAGEHTAVWNAGDLPAGFYICRLMTGGHIQSIKLLLLK